MKRQTLSPIPSTLAALALLSMTACHANQAPSQTPTPKEQVIETITVHPQPVTSQLVLPARIMANPTDMVHIYPLISGRVLSSASITSMPE